MNEQWKIAWKDYYRVLQVDEQAEPEVIEGAYRKLAQKYHPDRAGNTDRERIKLINEAHEILGDPDRRRAYNRSYRVRKNRPAAAASPQSSLSQQTGPEFFEKAEEARKLAREADEKLIEAHKEVETTWQAFRDSEKSMEEARNAVRLTRKTLRSLEEQAAAARQEVTKARNSVRQAEKTERDAWKEAKEILKKTTEAQAKERNAWKALEGARRQALEAERTTIGAARWTEDVRRKAAQIQAGLKDARVQKEAREAEKKEREARNRADKARKKVSFFEEKQVSALNTTGEWARKIEEAERLKTDAQQATEAARRLVVEAEKRETKARKAVEEARHRVTEAETREAKTRQAMEDFRQKATGAEKRERDARQALDTARRRAEEALKKADEARQKATEARKKAQEARDRMDAAKEREAPPPAAASVFNPAAAEEDEREIRAQRLHTVSMRFHRTLTFGLGLFTVGTETAGLWEGRTGAGRSCIDHGAYDVKTRPKHWQTAWAGLRRLRPDFVVTLKARKTDGADDQGFGLVFRPAASKDDVSSQTWYFFSLWPRGEAGYHRLDGSKDRALSGLTGMTCPSLRPGDAVNELRVVWRKDRSHIFVNGTYLISLSGLPEGALQMGALVLGGGRVRFTGLDLLCTISPRRRRFFVQTIQWGRVEALPAAGSVAS